jgi:hemolysin III
MARPIDLPMSDAVPETDAVLKPLLRGWSHLLALAACAVLGCVVVWRANGASAKVATGVYAVGITTMLGVSAMYHRVRWGERARSVIERLDHTAIFLGIAATYTPVAALALDGWARPTVLAIVWTGAAAGSSLVWLPVRVSRAWSAALYAMVGWAAVFVLPQLLSSLGATAFGLVLGGGVAYTVGAVVYALRKPDPWPRVFGFHEVFHAFTLVGVGTHLAAIGLIIVPQA